MTFCTLGLDFMSVMHFPHEICIGVSSSTTKRVTVIKGRWKHPTHSHISEIPSQQLNSRTISSRVQIYSFLRSRLLKLELAVMILRRLDDKSGGDQPLRAGSGGFVKQTFLRVVVMMRK